MPKYKKRKDGRYLAQVQTGYDEETGKPKYKNIYGRTLSELDEKITAFKSDFHKGIIVDDKNITVKMWAEEWLNTYKNDVGRSTKIRYEYVLNKQIIPVLGHYKLSQIKLRNVQNLINDLERVHIKVS